MNLEFSPEQNAALAAPLDRSHVAQRQQGGGKVSYIEGWHAIAEANRIFGFDGWHREMVALRQLGDPREVDGKWRVEYSAHVRVTVGGIIREGCGFGQGIDRDVGQAHESALKEAETDAMKRAFMTFGNPFGLALYDKSQSNVADAPTRPEPLIDDGDHALITGLAEAAGVPLTKVCERAGVSNLNELLASAVPAIVKKLNLTIDQKTAEREKEPA